MSRPQAQDVAFIRHLTTYLPRELPDGREYEGNRAALAALRRGLGKDVGEAPEMYPWVVPALRGVDPRDEDAYYLVASLFGLYAKAWAEEGERRDDLGASMARLKVLVEGDGPERRFVALLNASRRDLPEHLRHAISLLKSRGVAVDWAQLLRDVRGWGLPDHPVQRQWASSFWAGAGAPEDDGGESPDTAGPDAPSGARER